MSHGSRQQEGKWPGRIGLEQPELPGFHPGVMRDFGQIPAHQREVMVLVRRANPPDPLQGILVTDMAAQRIAGVRGIGDYTPWRTISTACRIRRDCGFCG